MFFLKIEAGNKDDLFWLCETDQCIFIKIEVVNKDDLFCWYN